MDISDDHGSTATIPSHTFQVELIDAYGCNPNYDIILDLDFVEVAEADRIIACEDIDGFVGIE
jgi:hypothetical protein